MHGELIRGWDGLRVTLFKVRLLRRFLLGFNGSQGQVCALPLLTDSPMKRIAGEGENRELGRRSGTQCEVEDPDKEEVAG